MSDGEPVEEINTAGALADIGGVGAEAIAAAINGGGGGSVEDLLKSPAVMEALQAQLMGMAGASSGLYDSLSPAVKNRCKALKQLANQSAKLDSALAKEVAALEMKYEDQKKVLFAKRTAIVAGEYEPTEEECVWEDEEDEEEDEEEAPEEDGEDAAKGIPHFWLTALQAHPALAEFIQDHDIPILELLEDITVVPDADANFTINFHFPADNEYFTESVLTKTYQVSLEVEDGDAVFNGPQYKKLEGCEIGWKAAMNPTVKIIKKKQRKKDGPEAGKIKVRQKKVPQESFFSFFSPPAMPNPEDPDPEMTEEQEEAIFKELEITDCIKEKVVPHAVLYFTGEAAGLMDEDDDMMGEEGGHYLDGDDDDDEEDPDYVPPADGEQPAECQQGTQ